MQQNSSLLEKLLSHEGEQGYIDVKVRIIISSLIVDGIRNPCFVQIMMHTETDTDYDYYTLFNYI